MKTFAVLLCLLGGCLMGAAAVPGGDCQTHFGVSGEPDELIKPKCSEGMLYWNYPEGSVRVLFARTLVPKDTCPSRGRMKVCLNFEGASGQVHNVTDMTVRRNTGMPLGEDQVQTDDDGVWNCTKYRRSRRGILLTLDGPMSKEIYVSFIRYRLEVQVHPKACSPKNGKNRQGNRRGPGKGAGKRGNRGKIGAGANKGKGNDRKTAGRKSGPYKRPRLHSG